MKSIPVEPGLFYHIYNRGNNRETVFRTPENHRYFLALYAKYVAPIAATYSYCLLPNHFHILVRIHTDDEQRAWYEANPTDPPNNDEFRLLNPSQQIGNLLNAYAKAFNRAYDRVGSLFQKPFQRIPIDDERYLRRLVCYIHRNPERHGLCDDFSRWPYSSYRTLLSSLSTRLERDTVLGWFGGHKTFRLAHQHYNAHESDRLFYEEE